MESGGAVACPVLQVVKVTTTKKGSFEFWSRSGEPEQTHCSYVTMQGLQAETFKGNSFKRNKIP